MFNEKCAKELILFLRECFPTVFEEVLNQTGYVDLLEVMGDDEMVVRLAGIVALQVRPHVADSGMLRYLAMYDPDATVRETARAAIAVREG